MASQDIESGDRRPSWWSPWASVKRVITLRTALRRRNIVGFAIICLFAFRLWTVPPHHDHHHGPPESHGFDEIHRHHPSIWDWLDLRQYSIPFVLPSLHERRIQKTLARYDLAPDDPYPHQLPPAKEIMPDIKTTHLPYPASHERFPSERLRELYPAGPPDPDSEYHENIVNPRTPIHPFIRNWTSPDWFHSDGRNHKALPKVQWDFSKHPISRKRRKLNDERKEAVKRAFVYSWQKYKDHAWGRLRLVLYAYPLVTDKNAFVLALILGHDEVKPVTAVPSNPFQGWGATIIDSLETLLIMGLQAEYELCREHVNKVDFRLISGADWARGWRADLEDSHQSDDKYSEDFDFKKRGHLEEYVYVDEETERPWRESHQLMATFETGIRYLGGLVGAYDLSGDPIVLERAKELGKILGRGFDTPSGLVMARFDAGSKSDYFHNGRVSLAEVGSMNLELTRLSQVTGDRWYFDQAQRAIDYIENIVIPASELAPLVPSMFDSNVGTRINGYYSFGAMADSYYEYLIKQHQLIGAATNQFASMYAQAIDKAQELMFANLTYYPGRDMLTISGYNHPGRGMAYELEHLTCFAGGMLGLGSRLLGRPQDLISGSAFTKTCYHLGASTASGLQPEKVNFFDTHMPDTILYENVTAIIEDEEDEYITVTKLKGTPQGTVNVDGRYLGRPETAESVFYMFVAEWISLERLFR
jgi:mannosyl-oligosaccharide alpha-1,2-mannosidase